MAERKGGYDRAMDPTDAFAYASRSDAYNPKGPEKPGHRGLGKSVTYKAQLSMGKRPLECNPGVVNTAPPSGEGVGLIAAHFAGPNKSLAKQRPGLAKCGGGFAWEWSEAE